MNDDLADVVTMGEAMRLLVAEPGVALRRAASFSSGVVGAETNVAVGLARLGVSVRWFGRVGDDPAGHAVLANLRAENVDTSAVELDPERPTGLLMRESHPARPIPVQYYRTGSAACGLSGDYVRVQDLAGVRLVHVSGITPMLSPSALDATRTLFEAARASGALVSFDPNVRLKLGTPDVWRDTVGPLLRRADWIFAGEDELELITGTGADEATATLLAGPAAEVIVKHADKSATVTTADGRWRQPPLARTVVDTVGAGDALVSGYLAARLRGDRPRQALRSGAVSAALVVGAVVDTEGLPDAVELARATAVFTGSGTDVDR